jgi:hypothetical protein
VVGVLQSANMEHTHTHDSVQTTARDFFIYLAFLITLVWLVVAFINFSFGVVDLLLPDILNNMYGLFSADTLTNSMASLIIVTPFFLFIGSRINKDLGESPEKKSMWVRKWLLYALLFLAFIVTLTDLVLILRAFLMGELTLRFILKALSVLIISGAVFSYFLFELKRDVTKKTRVPRYSAISFGIVVLALIVAGFIVAGSPVLQREMRLDAERIQDLENLKWQIELGASEGGKLLETLDEYEFEYVMKEEMQDPVTGEAYEYRVLSEDTYELCATFAHASDSRFVRYDLREQWDHEGGRQCFQRKVDFTKDPLRKY